MSPRTTEKALTIRVATRKSPLALWQANYVAGRIRAHHPAANVELVAMTTRGDKILDTPLAKIGGKGLFVKELEQALLDERADLAVHSMKDVPMAFPEGLVLGVVCPREQPRDAFVSNAYSELGELPQGAIVGTSSLRRQCQLRALRPDLVIRDLRGNVGTRLKKLDQGEYAAIILAAAGLLRLDLAERIRTQIATSVILPAVGQGAVGIELRADDTRLLQRLRPLGCTETTTRVTCERAFNQHLKGGCQVPIAGFSEIKAGVIHFRGLVGSVDGAQILRAEGKAPCAEARELGIQVAEQLLAAGAAAILAAL